MTRRFIGEYARALEGTYRSHVEMENEEVELEIADTAGEVWCCLSGYFVLYNMSNYSRSLTGSYLRSIGEQMHR